MSNPRELLGRAEARRPTAASPAAAPTPASPAVPAAASTRGEMRAVSTLKGGHALYTQLMRQHDSARGRQI